MCSTSCLANGGSASTSRTHAFVSTVTALVTLDAGGANVAAEYEQGKHLAKAHQLECVEPHKQREHHKDRHQREAPVSRLGEKRTHRATGS